MLDPSHLSELKAAARADPVRVVEPAEPVEPVETLAFLRALFAFAPPRSLIEVRTMRPDGKPGPREWFPVEDPEAAARFAADRDAKGLTVYHGCAPRIRRGGGAEDVAAICALVADVDAGDGKPHATKAEALAAVNRLALVGLAPSLLVDSGGGLHAYYLLDEPAEPEDFPEARAIMQRIALALGSPGRPLDAIDDPPASCDHPGPRTGSRAGRRRWCACWCAGPPADTTLLTLT
jgi:hypothetical protein